MLAMRRHGNAAWPLPNAVSARARRIQRLTPAQLACIGSLLHHCSERPASASESDLEVAGLELLPGRIHYIHGRDHAAWRTGVATYARVAYREAYPGIDAIYKTTTGSRFEQEFLIRRDANPTAIRLAFDGVQKVAVDDTGDLVLTTAGAPVRLGKPVAYQEIDGVRRAVSVAWSTRGSNEASFRLGPYDRSHALVIDPVITWATYLGGSGADQAFAIAVDSAGNSYVTGDTDSINFPTTDGSRLAIGASMTDVFVTKLNPTGTALVYSIYIGGSGTDGGRGIAVDPTGNAYVGGRLHHLARLPDHGGRVPAAARRRRRGSSDGCVRAQAQSRRHARLLHVPWRGEHGNWLRHGR